jgi:DNA-binding MarR family transcriptional regulator
MSQLAERVLLSPAGTTHLVTRLERDGLVRREVDPADGRKWFAVLTEAGDRTLQAARPTHNDVLRRTLLAATSPTDRRTLRRIWNRVSTQAPHPLVAADDVTG